MTRLVAILSLVALAPMLWVGGNAAAKDVIEATVYKSPTCGCCSKWVAYLEERDFKVKVVDQNDLTAVKGQLGVSPALRSCHTAVVDGYAIEGHVPVDDILRLLKERPAVAGLAAAGMPRHSPGMMSIEPKGYDVLSFTRAGDTTTFSAY